MRTIDELRKEALSDLQYEQEQRAKNEIKTAIQNIVAEQKRMAESAKKISEYQAHLKAITVDTISVEI